MSESEDDSDSDASAAAWCQDENGEWKRVPGAWI